MDVLSDINHHSPYGPPLAAFSRTGRYKALLHQGSSVRLPLLWGLSLRYAGLRDSGAPCPAPPTRWSPRTEIYLVFPSRFTCGIPSVSSTTYKITPAVGTSMWPGFGAKSRTSASCRNDARKRSQCRVSPATRETTCSNLTLSVLFSRTTDSDPDNLRVV